MTTPPPHSTLFPYTTLFRSLHEAIEQKGWRSGRHGSGEARDATPHAGGPGQGAPTVSHSEPPGDESSRLRLPANVWKEQRQRSEEHTSELQSRRDLVCRLLL